MIHLPDISGIKILSGINYTLGPIQGLSKFTKDMSDEELNDSTHWIPLCSGKDFNLFSPVNKGNFRQYGRISKIKVDLSKNSIFWRGIAGNNDQRTLIVSSQTTNYWCNHNTYIMQFDRQNDHDNILFLLSGLPIDFFVRSICSVTATRHIIESIPIPDYSTQFMDIGIKLMSDMENTPENRARIDVLVWLHYGNKSENDLVWIVNNHFRVLKNIYPDYDQCIKAAFDEYRDIPPQLQPNLFKKPNTLW